MTVTAAPRQAATKLLTYDDYMAEEESNRQYDITDGFRVFAPSLTIAQHDIRANIMFDGLRPYQSRTRRGKARLAPCDVLISHSPLRTRQPDLLFISRERYAGRTLQDATPLSPAPELVVEVLSPGEARGVRSGKIADYCAVDVKECWVVSPEGETVEVLRLTPGGPERAALYGAGQTAQSLTFPDLALSLDDIFRVED